MEPPEALALNDKTVLREYLWAIKHELDRLLGRGGSSFDGTLGPDLMLIGDQLTNQARTIYAQRLFDLTPDDSQPDDADPNYYHIDSSDIFVGGELGNDGSLATWRPDVDCADGVALSVGGGYSGDVLHPNGATVKADELKTSTRVMTILHNDPPSVIGGVVDFSGRWWQLLGPSSLRGMMDVDPAMEPIASDPLIFDETSGKWSSGIAYGVNTTDATVTTARLLDTLPDDKSYLVEARVVARQTGGAAGSAGDTASFVIRGTFDASSGTMSQVGATQQSYVENSVDATWDADFSVSGGDVLIDVTGAVDKNITWRVSTSITRAA